MAAEKKYNKYYGRQHERWSPFSFHSRRQIYTPAAIIYVDLKVCKAAHVVMSITSEPLSERGRPDHLNIWKSPLVPTNFIRIIWKSMGNTAFRFFPPAVCIGTMSEECSVLVVVRKQPFRLLRGKRTNMEKVRNYWLYEFYTIESTDSFLRNYVNHGTQTWLLLEIHISILRHW